MKVRCDAFLNPISLAKDGQGWLYMPVLHAAQMRLNDGLVHAVEGAVMQHATCMSCGSQLLQHHCSLRIAESTPGPYTKLSHH